MICPKLFSEKYEVRKLTFDDIPQIADLCKKNTMFYKYCPPFVTEESIKKDMQALPRAKTISDKYYVGFFDGGKFIAVMDIIDHCPDEDTVFIGFFMLDLSFQNKGIGSDIIKDLCSYLKKEGYMHIRLGWTKGNPQSESFWHKMGFIETGFSYDTDLYTVIVAQLDL